MVGADNEGERERFKVGTGLEGLEGGRGEHVPEAAELSYKASRYRSTRGHRENMRTCRSCGCCGSSGGNCQTFGRHLDDPTDGRGQAHLNHKQTDGGRREREQATRPGPEPQAITHNSQWPGGHHTQRKAIALCAATRIKGVRVEPHDYRRQKLWIKKENNKYAVLQYSIYH